MGPDGALAGKRPHLRFDADDGLPDGSTVDAEGCLWIAFWDGWCVRRYSPTGNLLQVIRLPCARVTKITFGGEDLRTMYVVTAREGLAESALAAQPLAGGVFALSTRCAGLPQHRLRMG